MFVVVVASDDRGSRYNVIQALVEAVPFGLSLIQDKVDGIGDGFNRPPVGLGISR
jgi:hypothetical protein